MNASVTTSDGVKISFRHISKGRDSVVVVAPGFFQSKETPTFRRIVESLAEHFDVMAMDFRGHGRSGGYYTFSAKEKNDLRAVIEEARRFYRKVGVLGFSYGGSIAIIEQAEFRNIDSLICVSSPMASEKIEFKWWTPHAIRLGMKGLERGAGFRPGNPYLEKTRPIDVVGSLKIPVMFVHGAGDPTVYLRHSEDLFQTAKEPKKLRIFEKGSHAEEIYRIYPQEFMNTVTEWFKDTINERGC